MRSTLQFAGLGIVLLTLTGCGGPKIDASSEEAFKTSTETVMKTLDEPTKEKFTQAMAALMMKHVTFSPGSVDDMTKKLKETFDGKTAEQIIAEGKIAEDESKSEMKKMMSGGN